MRKNAIIALGKISSHTTIPALVNALKHEEFYVRRIAAEALDKIGSEAAISELVNALTQIRRNLDYKNCLKIAVWYHPLDSAYSDRITDQGFLEQLAVNGFRLFLHGHIHKAETSLFRYDMSSNGRNLDRICAGTFGAPVREWVPGYPLQYNLLKIADNQLTVYTRRREELNSAWKPDARWLQAPGKPPLDYYAIAL